MSEFLLIVPGPNGSLRQARADARDPAAILADLLAALDAIGASLPAAQLSLAIDNLCIQFNLAKDSSGMD